jgi:3-oxoacyl-[acyl-carrier-protein] synthase-3
VTAGRYARIAGVGSALPPRAVPNSFFETIVETSDEWIVDRTGIRERRFAGPGETTATLAADAATAALRSAGLSPQAVDLVVVATCTPDQPVPSTGAFVQTRLGITCPAFDVNAACSGFVYGLSVGDAFIRSGSADRILVIGSEVMSRFLDMTDRGTCILFGDGAGAAVLEPGDSPGIIDSTMALDGSAADLLLIPGGGSLEPASPETVAAGRHYIQMPDGRVVFKLAVTAMADACLSQLEKAGLTPRDVDVLIAHQANTRIIVAVGKRLGIDLDRAFINVDRVGNTSAASIAIAMDEAWRAGRIKPGDLVLATAFGAGLSWGANLIRWTAPLPEDVSARAGRTAEGADA